jgi:hypothetical protein
MPGMRSTAWLASAAGALAIGACGGGDDRKPPSTPSTAERRPSATPSPPAAPAPATRAGRSDARIVRAWADSLRQGDVRAAASYFALPSLVSNGTPPIQLTTRDEVLLFNRTLSCGAKVIRTEGASHGFVITTFRLTERPGPGKCGSGTGQTARTAFRIRDEHITDWLRLEDAEPEPQSLS